MNLLFRKEACQWAGPVMVEEAAVVEGDVLKRYQILIVTININ